jgi:hypothetical protein
MLVGEAAGEGPQSRFALHAFTTFQERRFMTLGCVEVKVRVGKDGRASIKQNREQEVTHHLAVDLTPGTYDGRVLVLFSTTSRYLLVVLVIHPECYVIRSFGTPDENEWDDLKRYAVNQPISESVHRDLEAGLDEAIETSALQVFMRHTERNAMRAADMVYKWLATLNTREDACDAVMGHLRENGLLTLLDCDTHIVRSLAAISLANTVGTDIGSMKVIAQFMHISEEDIDKALKTARERHGMKLISVSGQHALALV